ncbi:MAG: hypothetical protein SWX82_31535 [Cyanobacteriota bacterium]|nr:hypothetical protein [Cyanobacteriota bacterium]
MQTRTEKLVVRQGSVGSVGSWFVREVWEVWEVWSGPLESRRNNCTCIFLGSVCLSS